MKLPSQVPVMTLPNATLFPQAFLPLYIFERRYRKMLSDALSGFRMFTVAMQRPDCSKEDPCRIAGLGLIRVSVAHQDGTSHLILQGLTRVQLVDTVQTRPYRIQTIEPLQASNPDSVVIDALMAKIHELVAQRLSQGTLPLPFPLASPKESSPKISKKKATQKNFSAQELLEYLGSLHDPDQAADLITCSILPDAQQRQVILETVDLEHRLKHLIHFLMAEIQRHANNPGNES